MTKKKRQRTMVPIDKSQAGKRKRKPKKSINHLFMTGGSKYHN